MFLVLILFLSLVILILRLSYTGVSGYSLARWFSPRTKDLKKKIFRATERIILVTQKFILHLLIVILSTIRSILFSVGIIVLLIEGILIFAIVAIVSSSYVLLLSDGVEFSDSAYYSYSSNTTTSSYSDNSFSGNLDFTGVDSAEARDLLTRLQESWGSEVTDERVALILKGATRIGKAQYSMWDSRRGGSDDNQIIFDCSSFVGWCFYKTGHTEIPTYTTTADYTTYRPESFRSIDIGELIPGDLGLKNPSDAGGAGNHIGIYVGDIDGVKYFMHCTPGANVTINAYTNFTVFYRYTGWRE